MNNLFHDASLLKVACTFFYGFRWFLTLGARGLSCAVSGVGNRTRKTSGTKGSDFWHNTWWMIEFSENTFFLGSKSKKKINKHCDFISGSVWTTMNNSENASNVFVHITSDKFATSQWPVIFYFSGRHVIQLLWRYCFRKAPFFVYTKTQRGVFKFLRFEERFWKASFLWRISVDSRPFLNTHNNMQNGITLT